MQSISSGLASILTQTKTVWNRPKVADCSVVCALSANALSATEETLKTTAFSLFSSTNAYDFAKSVRASSCIVIDVVVAYQCSGLPVALAMHKSNDLVFV